jgi:hypothetical protein
MSWRWKCFPKCIFLQSRAVFGFCKIQGSVPKDWKAEIKTAQLLCAFARIRGTRRSSFRCSFTLKSLKNSTKVWVCTVQCLTNSARVSPGQWLKKAFTDWLTDWLIDWPTEQTGKLLAWLTNRPAWYWLTGWLTGWLTDWLTDSSCNAIAGSSIELSRVHPTSFGNEILFRGTMQHTTIQTPIDFPE